MGERNLNHGSPVRETSPERKQYAKATYRVTVEYHNNILKGKATVVVKAADGEGTVGGKSATFSIVSGSVASISK